MRHVLRITPLVLSFLLHPIAAKGQSPAHANEESGHKASCQIDDAEPTEADIALWRGDKKAAALVADAVAKAPRDSRNRKREIDSLLFQHKLDDAHTKLDAWIAAEPNNTSVIVSAADVRFADGDWLESYALDLKALKADPCNADAYAGSAQYESLAGFRATAQKHRALAHQLQPRNEVYRSDWIAGLPGKQHDDEMRRFIDESKSFDEKRRSTIKANYDKAVALYENRCELVSANGPAVIPMTPIYAIGGGIDYYALEVAFNGHKRLLQIDTGAGGFTLTLSAGGSIGLPHALKARVGGFGDQGSNAVDLARADSVRIGGLEFHNCPVGILSNFGVMGGSHIGQRLDTSDGLIGSNVFDRYLVTLDYVKHEVRLEPLPALPATSSATANLDPLGGSNDPDWLLVDRYVAPSMQSWTKIYRDGHELLMPTRINGTRTKIFEVDTGSFANLIDTRLAKDITTTHSDTSLMMGLSGITKIGEAGKFTADFAGLRLPVQSMNFLDLSKMDTGISGFLGYTTLSQLVMHIDYRDNLVLFEAPAGKKR